MSYLTNPPQPVPTPIRNYVSFEDRVSAILNRAGTNRLNPIICTNRKIGGVNTPNFSITEGVAFVLQFAIADATESITTAKVTPIDDENVPTGNVIDIKSLFTADTENMRFTANLVAGLHITGGSTSTKNLIQIQTNLGRFIQQVVYGQNAPGNFVTLGGQETSSGSRYRRTGAATLTGSETFNIPVNILPTWNDEIGRQHGAESVALTGNIQKPYGGLETVEILELATFPSTVLLQETEIINLSSLSYTPSAAGTLDVVFRFRSKKGSTESVLAFGYLEFLDPVCEDETNTPPSGTGGGVIANHPDVVVQITSMGLDSVGSANTSINVVLTGYKGGVRDNSSTPTAYAGVASGTQTFAVTSTGSHTLTMTDSTLLNADLITAELQNSAGAIKGNTLVFKRSYTEVSMPGAPVLSGLSSFDFNTNSVTATITDFGFPNTDATIYIRSVGSAITATTSAQSNSDTFADFATGELVSQTLSYSSSTATLSKGLTFSGQPKAVMIYAGNSHGISNIVVLDNPALTASAVRTQPVASSLQLLTTTTTDDAVRFSLTDNGGQTQGTFSVKVSVLPASSSVTAKSETFTGVSTTTGTKQLVFTDASMKNVDGWYSVQVIGYNANSEIITASNLAS